MSELKPCPFCGAVPKIEWHAWKEISETSGAYYLTAEHTEDCFFVRKNGMPPYGEMTDSNKDRIITAWNRREATK